MSRVGKKLIPMPKGVKDVAIEGVRSFLQNTAEPHLWFEDIGETP